MEYIIGGLVVIAAVAVIYGVAKIGRRIRYKISSFKYSLIGMIFKKGMSLQNEVIEDEPKSVSGMTRLCLPRILEDFPDFDYTYFRQLTENLIKNIFSSVNTGSLEYLENAADSLKEQVKIIIKDKTLSESDGNFSDIKIHKTEIMKYENVNGLYTITFQSAFEYIQSGKKVQSRFNVELAYIQDEEKISGHESENIVSSVCPNCGAPVKVLQSNCAYCGSLLTKVNIRSWKYIRFYET